MAAGFPTAAQPLRIADFSGTVSCDTRRSRPFACAVTYTSLAVSSNCCGHSAISPWNRYFLLLISAPPNKVHVFVPSLNDVVPAACPENTGSATVAPPIPFLSWNSCTFPWRLFHVAGAHVSPGLYGSAALYPAMEL